MGWFAAALLAGGYFLSTSVALCAAAVSGLALVAAFRGLEAPSVGVIALAGLGVWTLSSALWGADRPAAAATLPVLYAAALWLAEQADRRATLGALRVTILAVAVLALAGRGVGLAPTAAGSQRLQWPVSYANGLGLAAATGVVLWLGLPSRRPALARVAAAVCGLTALLTFSRTAVLGGLAALALLGVLTGRVPRRVAAATLLLCLVAAVLFGRNLFDRFAAPAPDARNAVRLVDVSGHGRVELWRVAWRDGERHWAVGVGAGNYRGPRGVATAHSLELQTFAELGIVGLLILGAFLVAGVLATRACPVAAAVFALWFVVSAVDWDWQLPAATLPAVVAVATAVRRSR